MKAVDLRGVKEPACWSWPVPELLPENALATLLVQHGLRPHISRNITAGPATAWQFVAFHAGRCAICGQPTDLLVVDHDHETQAVRGCICYACNALEGRADMDLPVIGLYRARPPAEVLNYHERFAGNGACQRLLSAVHATARARRYREIRMRDVSSELRRLAGHSQITQDTHAASQYQELVDEWRMIRQRGAQADEDLLQGLISALLLSHRLMPAAALADDWNLELDVERVQHSIHQLCNGAAKELGREIPALLFFRTKHFG